MNQINTWNSNHLQELSALQSCAPIITDFVYKCPVDTHNKLPEDARHINEHLWDKSGGTFARRSPHQAVCHSYSQWIVMSFFPSLYLEVQGDTYKAD